MTSETEPDPPSPCVGICTLNPKSGLCEGCFRTLDEIASWSRYSPRQKRQVVAGLEQRQERVVDAGR